MKEQIENHNKLIKFFEHNSDYSGRYLKIKIGPVKVKFNFKKLIKTSESLQQTIFYRLGIQNIIILMILNPNLFIHCYMCNKLDYHLHFFNNKICNTCIFEKLIKKMSKAYSINHNVCRFLLYFSDYDFYSLNDNVFTYIVYYPSILLFIFIFFLIIIINYLNFFSSTTLYNKLIIFIIYFFVNEICQNNNFHNYNYYYRNWHTIYNINFFSWINVKHIYNIIKMLTYISLPLIFIFCECELHTITTQHIQIIQNLHNYVFV